MDSGLNWMPTLHINKANPSSRNWQVTNFQSSVSVTWERPLPKPKWTHNTEKQMAYQSTKTASIPRIIWLRQQVNANRQRHIYIYYITLHYITLYYIILYIIYYILYIIVLYYIILYYIILYYIILYYIILYYIIYYYIILYYIILYYTILYYIILYYIILYVIILYYIILYYIIYLYSSKVDHKVPWSKVWPFGWAFWIGHKTTWADWTLFGTHRDLDHNFIVSNEGPNSIHSPAGTNLHPYHTPTLAYLTVVSSKIVKYLLGSPVGRVPAFFRGKWIKDVLSSKAHASTPITYLKYTGASQLQNYIL